MRKINLEPYKVKVLNEKRELTEIDYSMKDSVIMIMFGNDEEKLNAVQVLERNLIAEKILKAEKEILLEEADYQKLKEIFDKFTGFGRNEVEMVKRVLEAEEVKVKEEKK